MQGLSPEGILRNMAIDIYEQGDTQMFTFVSSVAPDSAPIFKVKGLAGTIIASITALTSDSTHYYALFTMPTSEGFYIGEWFAQKTVVGSSYNFIKKWPWQVKGVTVP